ncbi:exostosin domain-containing protein [Rubrivirga sp.]|uniref:exostosin domain-containing protein n=1 Tax=Rubrivirga sp. TaxID=1885344 RepID=UPI003B521B6F
MAKVYLTSTVPNARGGSFRKLEALAGLDRFNVHSLVDDPERADLILFAETAWGNELQWRARRHPLVKRYREKTFVHSELDSAVPYLPGVYTSVPKRWYRSDRVRTGSYLVMYSNPAISLAPPGHETRWLFSFVGDSRTHALRRRIFALAHPRALLEDTSVKSTARSEGGAKMEEFQSSYSESIQDSLFVLCPSGVSPSTVRLFEVMKTGRVPVILSDEWVPPEGPDWASFSVRVSESELGTIPALLERLEGSAGDMGKKARRAWEEWFSDAVAFHRTIEWCRSIAESRRRPESVLRWTAFEAFRETDYLLNGCRHVRDGVKSWVRSRPTRQRS